MSGKDALVLLLVAFALITVGVTWLTGPWGLIGCGVFLGVVVMFMEIHPRESDQ